MPNQVGQTATFTVISTDPDLVVAYVWEFWDGMRETTYDPVVTKVINQGGTLDWSCNLVDAYGRVDEIESTIDVNTPPVILDVVISANDLPPSYDTTITVTVSDPDSTGAVTVALTGETSQVVTDQVSGHTQGSAVFTVTGVSDDVTLTLTVSDTTGGTTTIPVFLRVSEARPIIASINAVPSSQRIGPLTRITFNSRMVDANEGGTPGFQWQFRTTDGWVLSDFAGQPGFVAIVEGPTTVGYGHPGVTTIPVTNVYYNTLTTPVLDSQLQGAHVVRLVITPQVGSIRTFLTTVSLLLNHEPVIVDFRLVDPEEVVPNEEVTLEVLATDEDGDYLVYEWNLTSVVGNGAGLVANPVTATPTGYRLVGTVTVTDSLGASVTESIPDVMISSSIELAGVVDAPFSYTPRAMATPPVVFTVGTLPAGLVFTNGVITGTPIIAGVTATALTATTAEGVDTRQLTFTISEVEVAPGPPINLRINGDGTNPRYSIGETITAQWTVTRDGGALPTSEIEIRNVAGELKTTLTVGVGVDIISISSTEILAILGSNQDFIVRVFSKRNDIRSVFPASTRVTYV